MTQEKNSKSHLGKMIAIPEGRFLMGSKEGDPYISVEEQPQHWVKLRSYSIGKNLVTRGEYRRFMEAGGYDNPAYWSPDGWKWKEGDTTVHSGMYGAVR